MVEGSILFYTQFWREHLETQSGLARGTSNRRLTARYAEKTQPSIFWPPHRQDSGRAAWATDEDGRQRPRLHAIQEHLQG